MTICSVYVVGSPPDHATTVILTGPAWSNVCTGLQLLENGAGSPVINHCRLSAAGVIVGKSCVGTLTQPVASKSMVTVGGCAGTKLGNCVAPNGPATASAS